MKVLLVNGSPHEHGCTDAALREVMATLRDEGIDSEIYWIGNEPVGGCVACRACKKSGKCALGGKVNELRELAGDADGFIFGTPVHYAAASGNMTAFMDRLFYSEMSGGGTALRFKPAAAVLSARRAGTTAAFDQMNKYFTILEMPVISSRYWNMVHGAKAEDVQKDEEGLYTMRVLARNMAYILKCIESGKAAGVPLPAREAPIATNFIR